jgi:hypothetical protein
MAERHVLELLRSVKSDLASIKLELLDIQQSLGFLESAYTGLSRRMDEGSKQGQGGFAPLEPPTKGEPLEPVR